MLSFPCTGSSYQYITFTQLYVDRTIPKFSSRESCWYASAHWHAYNWIYWFVLAYPSNKNVDQSILSVGKPRHETIPVRGLCSLSSFPTDACSCMIYGFVRFYFRSINQSIFYCSFRHSSCLVTCLRSSPANCISSSMFENLIFAREIFKRLASLKINRTECNWFIAELLILSLQMILKIRSRMIYSKLVSSQ